MEQFDINQVHLAGKITRVWGRADDVYARLCVSNRGLLVEEDDAQATYVTLRLPQGAVAGNPVTLGAGDIVQISGFLTQHQIEVSLRRFLDAAGEADFIESVPPQDADAWHAVVFRRSSNVLNLRSIRPVGREAQVERVNHVVLEGIVARRWDYPRNGQVDRFVRLAIYDRWTRTLNGQSRRGLPRRLAHYVNVLLAEGLKEPKLKQRLRVTGVLRDRGRRVTLHEALLGTGRAEIADLIRRLPDAGRLHTISAQWESLHVQAEAVILYS